MQFNEAQLKELETVFGLTRVETLPIRDGVVARNASVWWRGASGPERVTANASHWTNIKEFPSLYQHSEPKHKVTYVD